MDQIKGTNVGEEIEGYSSSDYEYISEGEFNYKKK